MSPTSRPAATWSAARPTICSCASLNASASATSSRAAGAGDRCDADGAALGDRGGGDGSGRLSRTASPTSAASRSTGAAIHVVASERATRKAAAATPVATSRPTGPPKIPATTTTTASGVAMSRATLERTLWTRLGIGSLSSSLSECLVGTSYIGRSPAAVEWVGRTGPVAPAPTAPSRRGRTSAPRAGRRGERRQLRCRDISLVRRRAAVESAAAPSGPGSPMPDSPDARPRGGQAMSGGVPGQPPCLPPTPSPDAAPVPRLATTPSSCRGSTSRATAAPPARTSAPSGSAWRSSRSCGSTVPGVTARVAGVEALAHLRPPEPGHPRVRPHRGGARPRPRPARRRWAGALVDERTYVSVGVAAGELTGRFDRLVEELLDHHGVPAAALMVEVTGAGRAGGAAAGAAPTTTRLRGLGVQLAVDLWLGHLVVRPAARVAGHLPQARPVADGAGRPRPGGRRRGGGHRARRGRGPGPRPGRRGRRIGPRRGPPARSSPSRAPRATCGAHRCRPTRPPCGCGSTRRPAARGPGRRAERPRRRRRGRRPAAGRPPAADRGSSSGGPGVVGRRADASYDRGDARRTERTRRIGVGGGWAPWVTTGRR